MNDLPATIHILDRPYKLKINPATEQYLRRAGSLINDQAKEYGKLYSNKDCQDLLAMVALTQISQLLQVTEERQYMESGLGTRLSEIDRLLDTALKEESCT